MNYDILKSLELTENEKKQAKTKSTEEKRNIQKYITRYAKTTYEINNLINLGLNNSICDDLLGIVKDKKKQDKKIKKVAKGWQFTAIDWYAIQDFMRAYYCSKTDILTNALRCYIPSNIYDRAAMELVNEYYSHEDIHLTNTPHNIAKNFDTIGDYNIVYNKNILMLSSEYEKTLMSFSLNLLKLDALATQLFKEWAGFSYNSIIENAIRSFLLESNYQNAEEILNLFKEQDKRRTY